MGFVNGIFLIVLGALCVPALIAKKNPNAKELLDKIAPFQGIIGFVSFLWGIWIVIQCIINIGWIGIYPPRGIIIWATWLINALLSVFAGAILGWGLIQKNLLAKASADVKAKAENSLEALRSFQPKIGVFAIIFGVWVIVSTIVIW